MKDQLITNHRGLIGNQPSFEHLALYEVAPKKRGFRSGRALTTTQEERLFEAVFMLALTQTFVPKGETVPRNVYLFVPGPMEAWAGKQIQRLATQIFAHCKQAKAVDLAKHLGTLFRHLMVGSRLTATMPAPDHWAAYGFEGGPREPKWLMDALLPVYGFHREDEADAG